MDRTKLGNHIYKVCASEMWVPQHIEGTLIPAQHCVIQTERTTSSPTLDPVQRHNEAVISPALRTKCNSAQKGLGTYELVALAVK
jgi:hypothetical protein